MIAVAVCVCLSQTAMEHCAESQEGEGLHIGPLTACDGCDELLCGSCLFGAFECVGGGCDKVYCTECYERRGDITVTCVECEFEVCMECAPEYFHRCETLNEHPIRRCKQHPLPAAEGVTCRECGNARCAAHAKLDFLSCVHCEAPSCAACGNDAVTVVKALSGKKPPHWCVSLSLSPSLLSESLSLSLSLS